MAAKYFLVAVIGLLLFGAVVSQTDAQSDGAADASKPAVGEDNKEVPQDDVKNASEEAGSGENAAPNSEGDSGAESSDKDKVRPDHPHPPSHLDPAKLGDRTSNFDFGENGFWGGLFSSLAMILVSEVGDKTFFIAAILSMKHGRMVVFAGAIGALALMTVLSAGLGYAVPNLLPKKYTQIGATVLFFYFGARLLKEALGMNPGEVSEELAEVEQELGASSSEEEDALLEAGTRKSDDAPKKPSVATHALYSYLRCLPVIAQQRIRTILTPIFLESFTLTFLAEWGDRSQVATIALAIDKDPFGVTFGGIVGHSICTAVACVGGRLLASKISERSVTFLGATLFLFFGIHSVFYGI